MRFLVRSSGKELILQQGELVQEKEKEDVKVLEVFQGKTQGCKTERVPPEEVPAGLVC